MVTITLAYIRETLSKYNPRSEIQGDIKAALTLFIESEPQPPKEDCINGLREDLRVEVLYSIDALKSPTTLYRIIRDYFSLNEVTYSTQVHLKLPMVLSTSFFVTKRTKHTHLEISPDYADLLQEHNLFHPLHHKPSPLARHNRVPTTISAMHTTWLLASRVETVSPEKLVRIYKNTSKITLMLVQIMTLTMNRN